MPLNPESMAQLITITESTFRRRVLAAPLPVVVRFGSPTCAASRAMLPLLEQLASTHAEQLLVATLNIDNAPLLAEQYAIEATPTLALFEHGELVTRIVGFIQDGLLQLFFSQVAQDSLAGEAFWRPTEEAFEDAVIVPLLQAWGFGYQRQVHCSLPTGRASGRGRVDFLVYDAPMAQPLTLIESKRLLLSTQDLGRAVRQAQGYAQALQVSSFVVAAPSGMWIYQLDGAQATRVRAVTSLEVQQHPEAIQRLLLQLQR
jgi:thioredoxin 1